MKVALNALLALAVMFALVAGTSAQDKKSGKEVTLKGKMTCSKCGLKETEACGNAIVVEKGGKKVTYYFDDKGKAEKYHRQICTSSKPGSVTGVVSEKDGKHYITPNKDGVKFD
jgi:Family of unknown function (DUF6370)